MQAFQLLIVLIQLCRDRPRADDLATRSLLDLPPALLSLLQVLTNMVVKLQQALLVMVFKLTHSPYLLRVEMPSLQATLLKFLHLLAFNKLAHDPSFIFHVDSIKMFPPWLVPIRG